MEIEIDKYSGFCFGVTNAIKNAEQNLNSGTELFCLGHIVHNAVEGQRLRNMGLKSIQYDEYKKIKNKNVLIRAHGEPPETYETAKVNDINIIDATCPVVLTLQKRIKEIYKNHPDSEIVIFGKKGHAEVNGLVGQTNNKAIVVSGYNDLDTVNITKDVFIFAQTTAKQNDYNTLIEQLKLLSIKNNGNTENIKFFDTICPSVRNRIPRLTEFVKKHNVIIFVSDSQSSNGQMLFEVCKDNNPRSYFVTDVVDINDDWFYKNSSVGISGATSTPLWLMEKIKQYISEISNK